MRIFYRRSGERVSRAHVRKSKLAHAARYREGRGVAGGRITANPRLADRFEQMSEEEFSCESGVFTYRDTIR